MLFDSHAHYNDSKFDEDRFLILDRMQEAGIGYIMNAADSMESIEKILKISEKYSFVYASVGVHPENCADLCEHDMDILEKYTCHEKVRAIGEIGLDYYWDTCPKHLQKQWFTRQIELAKKVKLPIIIHDRDAHADTMDIVRATNARDTGGVFHCYSGSVEMAREILSQSLYIAFGGTLTFKNAKKVKEVAHYVPLSQILIETDSPYLAPEPHRGKRNSSLFIIHVAEELAKIKGVSLDEVIRATTNNAKNLFKIED